MARVWIESSWPSVLYPSSSQLRSSAVLPLQSAPHLQMAARSDCPQYVSLSLHGSQNYVGTKTLWSQGPATRRYSTDSLKTPWLLIRQPDGHFRDDQKKAAGVASKPLGSQVVTTFCVPGYYRLLLWNRKLCRAWKAKAYYTGQLSVLIYKETGAISFCDTVLTLLYSYNKLLVQHNTASSVFNALSNIMRR